MIDPKILESLNRGIKEIENAAQAIQAQAEKSLESIPEPNRSKVRNFMNDIKTGKVKVDPATAQKKIQDLINGK